MTIKFKLDSIKKASAIRPIGYYEEVVSSGKLVGDEIEIQQDKAMELLSKYRPESPIRHSAKDKDKWGPILWKILHQRPFQAKDLSVENAWLHMFSSWIPCGECSRHWREALGTLPPKFQNKGEYYQWTVDIHNRINDILKKPNFYPEPGSLSIAGLQVEALSQMQVS